MRYALVFVALLVCRAAIGADAASTSGDSSADEKGSQANPVVRECPKNAVGTTLSPCVLVPEAEPALGVLVGNGAPPTSPFSGNSFRVNLPPAASVGQGFALISGVLRNTVMANQAQSVVNDTNTAVSYDLKYVDSYEQLAQEMDLNISVSYSGFGGGASASLNLFKSARFSSTKAYVLVHMTVVTGTQSLRSTDLTKEALDSYVANGPTQFETTYGDTFVQQIIRGAELYALMEFSAAESQSVDELRSSISASYGGFKGSTDFKTRMEKLSKERNVRVTYAQTGGNSGRTTAGDKIPDTGGVVALTPEELLGRIREFPAEAIDNASHSAILYGIVTDDGAAGNQPPKFEAVSKLNVWWALQDLQKTKIAVDEIVNTAEDVQAFPERYVREEQSKAADLRAYGAFLSVQLDRLGQVVSAYPARASMLTMRVLPSETSYLAVYDRKGPTQEFSGTMSLRCPAAWSDVRLPLICLFGWEAYKPQHVPVLSVLSGDFMIAGCRGDGGRNCTDTDYHVSFDGKDSNTKTLYQIGFANPMAFVKPPIVAADPITAPWGLSYSVKVISVDKTGFTFAVHQNKINGDGNHGWIGELHVRWIAYEPKE